MQQVFAKPPLPRQRRHVLVRRRHDAELATCIDPATDGAKLARLDRAQELCLHRGAHARYLVQEQRPAIRLREIAGMVGHRAGERAAHVAEHGGLEHGVAHRCGVEAHERPGAPAQRMDGARDELLPHAGGPEDEDGKQGRRDGGGDLADGLHRARFAEEGAEHRVGS